MRQKYLLEKSFPHRPCVLGNWGKWNGNSNLVGNSRLPHNYLPDNTSYL